MFIRQVLVGVTLLVWTTGSARAQTVNDVHASSAVQDGTGERGAHPDFYQALNVDSLAAVIRVGVSCAGCPGMDGDGVIDLDDFAAMILCLSGPGHSPIPPDPACIQCCIEAFDFDNDADVDVGDFAAFQLLFGDSECVTEGDSYAVVPGHLDCCPGLVSVGCEEPDPAGACTPCTGASYCTDCGDGVCGPGENACRCPGDCPCVAEGDSYAVVPGHLDCCPGLVSVGCAELDPAGACTDCTGASYCTDCGDGVCGPGENECRCPDDCAESCVAEGDSYAVVPGHLDCCPGLVSVGCAELDPAGACTDCTGASYCTDCGDGDCGPGENECRCPGDCPESCVAEGDSYAVVPGHLDCCPGLVSVGCAELDPAGACTDCTGASYCTDCGDGDCGPGENACRCPGDCCVAEGDSYAVVPGHLDCCPGLVSVGCAELDPAGACTDCTGASYCTDCGDGVCGPGENECRCPDDCPESCVAEGDSYAVVPGHLDCCPGLVSVGCAALDPAGACTDCTGASYCTDCGDGDCGPGENACRCPGDCCVAEGDSYAIVPGHPDCCPGLVSVGCAEPDPAGACPGCDGASYCTDCGDGVCGPGENACRCPEDCPA